MKTEKCRKLIPENVYSLLSLNKYLRYQFGSPQADLKQSLRIFSHHKLWYLRCGTG